MKYLVTLLLLLSVTACTAGKNSASNWYADASLVGGTWYHQSKTCSAKLCN